nr:hypothetical protein [uncultured Duganella sp.]
MAHKSLLDTESGQPDDDPPPRAKAAAMNELITAVEVIKSNYATKEDLAGAKEDLAIIKANYTTKEQLAILNGKIDVLANDLQAFQTHAMQTFATKAELADAVYQLTWRMAGFAVVTISAMAAFVRYL